MRSPFFVFPKGYARKVCCLRFAFLAMGLLNADATHPCWMVVTPFSPVPFAHVPRLGVRLFCFSFLVARRFSKSDHARPKVVSERKRRMPQHRNIYFFLYIRVSFNFARAVGFAFFLFPKGQNAQCLLRALCIQSDWAVERGCYPRLLG